MVYRVPTSHSIVPSPVDQTQAQQTPPVVPWRGSLFVSGIRPSDRAGNQEIRVAALEIDGDSRVRNWPAQFIGSIFYETRVLHDVVSYVQQYTVPMCTFIADRHIRDRDQSSANELMFRNLSRVIHEHQTVVIARWGTPAIVGAGMIIYPVPNSSSLLVGALFLDGPFPDFFGVHSSVVPLGPAIPSVPPMHAPAHYAQGMVPSPYHHHSQSVSPHRSDPNSPVDPAAQHRQGHYSQYMVPYAAPTGETTSPSAGSSTQWTSELHYTGGTSYTSQQNPGQYH